MKKLKISIFLFGLAAVTSLTGCKSLYGKYHRPDVNAQGLVRDVTSATDTLAVADTASFGNLPWRSVFTDPQLQGLIQTALENNPH
jgi:multidrug efflux system outer membrane protein